MPRNRKPSIKRVSVLGSGKVREKDPIYQQAMELGSALASEGFTVFHGGFSGVMEAVAKGSRLAGGHNVGVTIKRKNGDTHFRTKNECPRCDFDAEIKMPCWQRRLSKLVEMGDAYVFLDGATGTLNELFFVWEMANKKLHAKSIILLGKKLHALVKFLQKDPSLEIPRNFHLATSISQTIKLLKK